MALDDSATLARARRHPSCYGDAAMTSFRALPVATLLVATLSGCAGARFHSKTGRAFEPVTRTAVRCDEGEARLVAAAGGEVIGTIAGHAISVNQDHEDIADKAQIVAAKKGGTHVVLTEKGVDFFTYTTPAQSTTDCVAYPRAVECQTVSTPATTTTQSRAKATFVVLRLSPEKWAALPETLRPMGR